MIHKYAQTFTPYKNLWQRLWALFKPTKSNTVYLWVNLTDTMAVWRQIEAPAYLYYTGANGNPDEDTLLHRFPNYLAPFTFKPFKKYTLVFYVQDLKLACRQQTKEDFDGLSGNFTAIEKDV